MKFQTVGRQKTILKCEGLPVFLVREAAAKEWTEVEAAFGFLAASYYCVQHELGAGARIEVKCDEGIVSRWRLNSRLQVEEADSDE